MSVIWEAGEPGYPNMFSVTGAGGSYAYPANLKPGDTITIKNNSYSPVNSNIQVNHAHPAFSRPVSIPRTLSKGQSLVLTVTNTEFFGSISIAKSGHNTIIKYFRYAYVDDITPDNWTFPDIVDAWPGATYYASKIISGVSRSIICKAEGPEAPLTKLNNEPNWLSGVNAINDDRVTFKFTAPPGRAETRYITLKGGDQTFNQKIVTKPPPNPQIYPKIPSGLSLPFSLIDVAEFYGYRGYIQDAYLSDYIRGGDYIPNITENSSVPTSTPIALSSLAGSKTSLYFKVGPPEVQVQVNTLQAARSLEAYWGMNGNFYVGYSSNMGFNMQFRITVVSNEKSGDMSNTNAYLDVHSTGFHELNANFRVKANGKQNTETLHIVKLKVEMRHKSYPSVVVTDYCTGWLSFYGP